MLTRNKCSCEKYFLNWPNPEISHLRSLLSWSTALAEAGQHVQSRVVCLLLHTVWLLHQGPPQPGAARPLSTPPAERRTKETSAAPARTGRGWGWTEPPRALPCQGVPLRPRSVCFFDFPCLLKLLWVILLILSFFWGGGLCSHFTYPFCFSHLQFACVWFFF